MISYHPHSIFLFRKQILKLLICFNFKANLIHFYRLHLRMSFNAPTKPPSLHIPPPTSTLPLEFFVTQFSSFNFCPTIVSSVFIASLYKLHVYDKKIKPLNIGYSNFLLKFNCLVLKCPVYLNVTHIGWLLQHNSIFYLIAFVKISPRLKLCFMIICQVARRP